MGERILPSSCCTTRIRISTINAVVGPLDTSAISTEIAPADTAPTMGTKPAKKVIVAKTNASGTPIRTSPMPMNRASINETIAWARIKPANVFQIRVNSSDRCKPTVGPVLRRTHGKKRSPSFRKKNVSTSMIPKVTATELADDNPANTPDAILPACS